jgi:hypothetical protein
VAGDRPRLLARRSQYGYTESTSAALRQEPEAVSEQVAESQTLAIRRAEREARRRVFEPHRDRMIDSGRLLVAQGLARGSDLRVVLRILARWEKRL